MKQTLKYILLALLSVLITAFVLFLAIQTCRGITEPQPARETPLGAVDPRDQERQTISKLQNAPWQGLRFLTAEKEWRFYAVAGEQRTVNISTQFDLVKVYFLRADGGLGYTWAATGVDIPGQGYYAAASAPLAEGDVIEVVLHGSHVFQSGVYWEDCDTEYCRLASMVDTILVLDDKDTGLSNAFIRYGWEPPTYPMYGFLCWQIRPYTVNRIEARHSAY